jgi:hypothetical protein
MRILFVLILLGTQPASASDAFLVACGDGKFKDQHDAKVALREEPDAMMEFYLNGEKQDSEEFDVASDEGSWIVTIPPKGDEPMRKFQFLESKKTVQEYEFVKRKQKAVGQPLKCIWENP